MFCYLRTSKNWSKGGSRSPSSTNGEWNDNLDSNGSFKTSPADVTLVNEEGSSVSLVECHNKLTLDAPKDTNNSETNNDSEKNHSTEDKNDSRKYRQNTNNHTSGVGQYKRQANQQYGNGYNYVRRYNNNNNHNYRNYGNK